MPRLTGEVAIVTGSTSGLGAEVARLFAAEGASIVVTGRNKERGTRVCDQIIDSGGHAVFVAADLTEPSAAVSVADAAAVAFGPPTVLVNNAIGHIAGDGAVGQVGDETWLGVVNVGLLAPAHLISAVVPAMAALGRGSIVNVSSRVASRGTPGCAAYTAVKGALEALTRSVAVDYAAAGIRCNAVRPGYILHEHRDASIDQDKLDALSAAQLTPPLTASDVAQACLFLASKESAGITGLVLPVDGGSTVTRAKVLG